ncbi:MAG: hypothetical protein JWR52_1358 [Marmoricola sp.]|nr:hypothetical protein [Marmoricola sp.]
MTRTRSRTAAAVLCTALTATALAGCGSSASSGTSGGPLTIEAFKAQANAICKTGNADIKQIGSGITISSSPTLVVQALHAAANRANKEVSDIRKLQAPSSIASAVNAWGDAINTATAKILKGGIEVLSGADPFAGADARAKALGLTSCESGSGT